MNILKRCDEYSLVLADELAKGSEIRSSTSIVASGIVNIIKRKSNFVFATHLHNVTEIEEIKQLKGEISQKDKQLKDNKRKIDEIVEELEECKKKIKSNG
mgnify:CR=1 FL=1